MKISKIELQKKNKKRASIYVDEEFALGVLVETVYDFALKKGDKITKEKLDEIRAYDNKRMGLEYALKLVTARRYSELEIRRKLALKEITGEDCESIICRLKELGFINDYEFALCFANEKMNINKSGKIKIRNDLYKKGISSEIIDKVLSEFDDSENELQTAYELALKKYNTSYKNDDKMSAKRKLSGFLMRKGYSYEITNSVCNRVFENE